MDDAEKRFVELINASIQSDCSVRCSRRRAYICTDIFPEAMSNAIFYSILFDKFGGCNIQYYLKEHGCYVTLKVHQRLLSSAPLI